jgi:hypothetical protein
MRLTGEFAGRAFHMLLKNRGEVRGIAEAAAVGYLSDVEPGIQQGTLGKLYPLPDQELFQSHPGRPPENPA